MAPSSRYRLRLVGGHLRCLSTCAPPAVVARSVSAPSCQVLTPDQVRAFHDDGFVVLDGVLRPAELLPVRRALERKLDRLAAALVDGGVVTDDYGGEPFETRMERLAEAAPGLPSALHGDRSAVTAMRSLCELWCHPRLLDICEQLLGTAEIAGHPVINLRIRTSSSNSSGGGVDLHAVPFHQDAAYLLPEADATLQIGVWLPLVPVPQGAGLLSFLRGGHRISRGCLLHEPANDGTGFLKLADSSLAKLKVSGCEEVECPITTLGSFVLFNNLVPHAGLPNKTGATRWSVDFRYQAMGAPHGDDHNAGLVQFSSSEPGWQMRWVAGPKAVTPEEFLPPAGASADFDGHFHRGRWGDGGPARDPTDLPPTSEQLAAHAASQRRASEEVARVRKGTANLLPWEDKTDARFWHDNEL